MKAIDQMAAAVERIIVAGGRVGELGPMTRRKWESAIRRYRTIRKRFEKKLS